MQQYAFNIEQRLLPDDYTLGVHSAVWSILREAASRGPSVLARYTFYTRQQIKIHVHIGGAT